jgi:hypothetical protein
MFITSLDACEIVGGIHGSLNYAQFCSRARDFGESPACYDPGFSNQSPYNDLATGMQTMGLDRAAPFMGEATSRVGAAAAAAAAA